MATFCNFMFFFSLCLISMAAVSESAHRLPVGGPSGWIEPTGNENETYNQWAARKRFQVGDSVYFKYTNDSVLVVDEDDYNRCKSSKPIFKYEGGNTIFRFDRYGFFFFISGFPAHCKSGQKLIVWVMSQHSISQIPAAAPESRAGGGEQGGQDSGSGQPASSSTVKATVSASSFVAAIVGIMVIFHFI